jgi:hypothetical protein
MGMRNDSMEDIRQKLTALPEGLAEKNIKSWEYVVLNYKNIIENNEPVNQGLLPVFKLAKRISTSEQAKLFRAGTSLYSLLISTAEKHGLKDGEPFIAIDTWRSRSPKVEYWQGNNRVAESALCDSADSLAMALQPFLERLWSETRDKENT